MRVLSYNVHGCVGTDGVCSVERIAEVIARSDPDVVGLQELDHGRARSQWIDQAQAIAELLSMHYHFHPAIRVAEEAYGDAVLSKYPVRLIQAGALPKPLSGWWVEERGALWVEIVASDGRWQMINTHFGLGRAERWAQALHLLGPEWVGAALPRSSLVVCGDFNSHPGGRVYGALSSALADAVIDRSRSTFPSRFPLLCLDHIFVGPGVGVHRTRVVRDRLTRIASDHLPIVAELESAD